VVIHCNAYVVELNAYVVELNAYLVELFNPFCFFGGTYYPVHPMYQLENIY
jgi:hypothetical protein